MIDRNSMIVVKITIIFNFWWSKWLILTKCTKNAFAVHDKHVYERSINENSILSGKMPIEDLYQPKSKISKIFKNLLDHAWGPFLGIENSLKEFIFTWWACFENPIHHENSSRKFLFPVLVQILTSNGNWSKIWNSNYWKVNLNRIFEASP